MLSQTVFHSSSLDAIKAIKSGPDLVAQLISAVRNSFHKIQICSFGFYWSKTRCQVEHCTSDFLSL